MLVKISSNNTLYVPPLIEVLERNRVSYSFKEGNIDFIVRDEDSLLAVNAYPEGVADKLFSKKKLQDTLTPFGFTALATEVINTPDAITLNNFIVKMERGTGGGVDTSNNRNRFTAVTFADKEVFKRHPLFDLYFKPGKYVAQEDVGASSHTAVSFFCAVNSTSDAWVLNVSTDKWVNGTRTEAILAPDGYPDVQEKLVSAIKTLGIKNTCATVQFIEKDGVLYPMDWNFRWGRNFHKQVINNEPQLYEAGILYMLGVSGIKIKQLQTYVSNKQEIATL